MGRYRKRPLEIEAVRWMGDNEAEIRQLALVRHPETGFTFTSQGMIDIHTLEGTMRLQPGDWLIRGVHNELYPCKHAVFVTTYEKAGDNDTEN